MNTIREIERLNQQELDNGVPIGASWHNDYKDTAYIFIGGLPFELTEGDILTIFSQFGNPVHVNLMRDKETGKSRGFAFLKYEDQRSTILAVDNMCGTDILGRKIRVDHTYYKNKDGEEELERQMEFNLPQKERERLQKEREGTAEREFNRGSRDSAPRQDTQITEIATVSVGRPGQETPPPVDDTKLLQDLDEDDPMRQYLIEKRRAELMAQSKERERREKQTSDNSHHHHRRHHHSSYKDDEKRHRRSSDKSSSHRRHRSPRDDEK